MDYSLRTPLAGVLGGVGQNLLSIFRGKPPQNGDVA